tara:strand:- start:5 stop:178 length:174 start_codon:yes stop_codon:yes gene_type:complete
MTGEDWFGIETVHPDGTVTWRPDMSIDVPPWRQIEIYENAMQRRAATARTAKESAND